MVVIGFWIETGFSHVSLRQITAFSLHNAMKQVATASASALTGLWIERQQKNALIGSKVIITEYESDRVEFLAFTFSAIRFIGQNFESCVSFHFSCRVDFYISSDTLHWLIRIADTYSWLAEKGHRTASSDCSMLYNDRQKYDISSFFCFENSTSDRATQSFSQSASPQARHFLFRAE